jgi:hypothetical protein
VHISRVRLLKSLPWSVKTFRILCFVVAVFTIFVFSFQFIFKLGISVIDNSYCTYYTTVTKLLNTVYVFSTFVTFSGRWFEVVWYVQHMPLIYSAHSDCCSCPLIATALFVFAVIYCSFLCVALLAFGFYCVVSSLFLVDAGPEVSSYLISRVCSCSLCFVCFRWVLYLSRLLHMLARVAADGKVKEMSKRIWLVNSMKNVERLLVFPVNFYYSKPHGMQNKLVWINTFCSNCKLWG